MDTADRNNSKPCDGFLRYGPLVDSFFRRMEERFGDNGFGLSGIATDYHELDKMTAGLQKGELIVLGGCPGMGKTALVTNITQHVSIVSRVPVGFISLDQSEEAYGQRMLASIARIGIQRLRLGILSDQHWPKLTRAYRVISENMDCWFMGATRGLVDIESIERHSRELKKENNIGLLVVDSLQMIRDFETKPTAIVKALKALALELETPVLVTSEVSQQAIYSRPNKRPMLTDLKDFGTGVIGETADLALLLYRDEVYNQAADNPRIGLAELNVAKQRNGPTGTIELAFLDRYCSFENLAR